MGKVMENRRGRSGKVVVVRKCRKIKEMKDPL